MRQVFKGAFRRRACSALFRRLDGWRDGENADGQRDNLRVMVDAILQGLVVEACVEGRKVGGII